MGFLTLQRFTSFPLRDESELTIHNALETLQKRLKAENMDVFVDKNRLDFAGNNLSFIHSSLDNLNGSITVRIANRRLVFDYEFSFIGPAIFLFVWLLIFLYTLTLGNNLVSLFFGGAALVFIWQLKMGVSTFDALVDAIGSKSAQAAPRDV